MSIRFRPWKIVVFALGLTPAIVLVWNLLQHNLGPNPVETLTHETGEWGLRFLLISLAVTPLRRVFRWNRLISYRRMLGLFSFFYIVLHFSIYLVFDHFFDLQGIIEDVIKRKYITVGFAGFILLLPLAITSFSALQRKMGRRWFSLHKLVYVIGILGVVHFWWLVKVDVTEPLIYATVLTILLSIRVFYFLRRQRNRNQN